MLYRYLPAVLLVLGVTMSTDSFAADPTVDAAKAAEMVKAGAVLLDVRSEEEWNEGHIKGAKLTPWQMLTPATAGLPADKNTPIVTYCASGKRSLLAAQKLQGLGYTRVVSLAGGFQDLADAGMPTQ